MLFQGQEIGADTPWKYFADHVPDLARKVKDGRTGFMSQFPRIATDRVRELLPDPADVATFESCKLSFPSGNPAAIALHRDLLRLRREDASLGDREADFDGAILSASAFVLRWSAPMGDRLLVVNLGTDLRLDPAPEPLLGPPARSRWRVLWSSEDPLYGGLGTPELDGDDGWRIPAESAALLIPEQRAIDG
jgi:maltooligosyltrehalose trehalohydrolase